MPCSPANRMLSDVFNFIGILGVPIFLIISGFFFLYSKSNIYSSLINLFVPLVVWGEGNISDCKY